MAARGPRLGAMPDCSLETPPTFLSTQGCLELRGNLEELRCPLQPCWRCPCGTQAPRFPVHTGKQGRPPLVPRDATGPKAICHSAFLFGSLVAAKCTARPPPCRAGQAEPTGWHVVLVPSCMHRSQRRGQRAHLTLSLHLPPDPLSSGRPRWKREGAGCVRLGCERNFPREGSASMPITPP